MAHKRVIAYDHRDGTVYGCGLTEHGQLPFLKFSKSGGADSSSSSEDEGEDAELAAARGEGNNTRNEITIPTRLRLPFVQVQALPAPFPGQVRRSEIAGQLRSISLCQACVMQFEKKLLLVSQQMLFWHMQARGGRMPVVSAVVAGGHSSAFLTSAPDEFPEPRGSQLLDRWIFHPISVQLIVCSVGMVHKVLVSRVQVKQILETPDVVCYMCFSK